LFAEKRLRILTSGHVVSERSKTAQKLQRESWSKMRSLRTIYFLLQENFVVRKLRRNHVQVNP
jgi:hypothetical protein